MKKKFMFHDEDETTTPPVAETTAATAEVAEGPDAEAPKEEAKAAE